MPPRIRITQDIIIDAAIDVARQSGFESINARTVSERLRCSTQPVMYHFSTIDNLKRAAYARVDRLHSEYMMNIPPGQNPILAIGLPAALQFALTVVSAAAQTRFMSQYGTEAVAAFGIVKKIDQLPLFTCVGVANGLLPMLAYYAASGNLTRRKQSFRLGCTITVGFASLCLIAYEIFAPQIAGLFMDDALTVFYAAGFLQRMVVAMPLMAVCYPMIIQFQAMGRAKESLILSILRKGVLDIPLLFLLDYLGGMYGLCWVQPLVDSIALVVSLLLYRNLNRKA